MSHSRNMRYLENNRIIFRRLPISDKPSEVYEWGWFYEQGTHEYYNLFNGPAKITTFKSLKWHLLVLWYLNNELDKEKFIKLAKYIAEKKNGFVTFFISESKFDELIHDIYGYDFETAPKNKLKKVIFKDFIPLTKNEKLSIVGKLLGRSSKATPSMIYECMLEMHELGEKITINKLAKHLNCTTRTIYRNLDDQLKNEKDSLNEEIQRTELRTA